MSGMYYWRINPKHIDDRPLEIYHFIFFLIIFAILEAAYRYQQSINIELKPKLDKIITKALRSKKVNEKFFGKSWNESTNELLTFIKYDGKAE